MKSLITLSNRFSVALISAIVGLSAVVLSATAQESASVSSRIASPGQVCMSGEPCAAAPVAAAPKEPRSGQAVYESKCVTCHAAGVAGAPKFGDAAAWSPRASQGIDTLFDHAWNGYNAMPAKGLCMDCSEDEIRGAIQHMVDNSQ